METLSIVIIISLQVYSYFVTAKKIKALKGVFTAEKPYRIAHLHLLQADIETVAPAAILANLETYKSRAASAPDEPSVSLGLLEPFNLNETGKAVVSAVNIYLLRNNGAVTDFNLIKDITERYSDALEEEIAGAVSIPLYLGLLGTLVGIIGGLSHISGLSVQGDTAGALLDNAIPVLLGGVKVAMIASFFGLLLTVLHSGIFFRDAKAVHGKDRNRFYTFIQVELLPLLNASLNATLYGLQANLLAFNRDFGQHIQRLDGLMSKNYDALMVQGQFMDTLSKIEIAEFATANVKVLNSLQKTVRSFEDFSDYAAAISTAIHRTDAVVSHLDRFMDRTDNLSKVVSNMMGVFDQNRALMEFLQSHFSSLDNSRQLVGAAVIDVSEYLGKAIEELKLFTEEKIAAVRTIEIHEAGLMKDTYPEKWKNLDELKKISQIVDALTDNDRATVREVQAIAASIGELKQSIKEMDKGVPVRLKLPSLKKLINRKQAAYEKA